MIAIIPARSGSKGLKNKNILKIKGKPLIAHTILSAQKSKYIKEIYVSTDSEIIKKISIKYGAKVPFLRPKKLSCDHTNAIEVYRYMINKLKKIKKEDINNIISLLPTSPLRNEKDIDNAIKIFKKKKADSVISVTEAATPISWFLKIGKEGKLRKLNQKNNAINNRQKTNSFFVPNGAIYIFDTKKILKKNDYYFKKTYGYLMPKKRSIDINDILDFNFAKNILESEK